jgi:hypothetical protein
MSANPPFFTIGATGSGYNINVNSLNFIGGTGFINTSSSPFETNTRNVTTSGLTTTPSFFVSDTNNQVGIIPNADASALNPITSVNDSLIYSYGPIIGTENVVLSTWSATTTGVKITPTTALIGAGGSTSIPTSSISCSESTVTINSSRVVITNRNIVIDNGGSAITVGNGASTNTANIILTKLSLASTKNFTTGNNTIIGAAAGNSLVVGSGNNTFIGYSAGSLTTGSNNICIGYNSQVPNASLSNQISIGTESDTLYIPGSHVWRCGPTINASVTLALPLAQFYVIQSASATTITLPDPVAGLSGSHAIFKRYTNAPVITFRAVSGGSLMVAFNGSGGSTSVTMTSSQFQCEFICNGTAWWQLNMA